MVSKNVVDGPKKFTDQLSQDVLSKKYNLHCVKRKQLPPLPHDISDVYDAIKNNFHNKIKRKYA